MRTVRALLIVLSFFTFAACSSKGELQSVPQYDGSLAAFSDFIKRHNKQWPEPARMEMFQASDGANLRYAHWPAKNPASKAGVVVFFQGRTEFIEKNIYTYKDLLDKNYEVWTLDWRGQGMSERMLSSPDKGHIDSFKRFVDDAHQFVTAVAGLNDVADVPKILVAHSMGGAIGTMYLMQYPDMFDRAVFSSPLIELPEGQSGRWLNIGNRIKSFLAPGSTIVTGDRVWKSSFRDDVNACELPSEASYPDVFRNIDGIKKYSHDYAKIAENECLISESRGGNPNLGLASPTSGWLRAALDATATIGENKEKLRTRLLIVAGGHDTIVSNAGQRRFCDKDNPFCCRKEIPCGGHELLIELEEHRAGFFRLFSTFVSSTESMQSLCDAL